MIADSIPPDMPLCADAFRKIYDRMATVAAVLRHTRFGMTLPEVHQRVVDEFGRYCQRTIRRDLMCLWRLGLVRRVETNDTQRRYLWLPVE